MPRLSFLPGWLHSHTSSCQFTPVLSPPSSAVGCCNLFTVRRFPYWVSFLLPGRRNSLGMNAVSVSVKQLRDKRCLFKTLKVSDKDHSSILPEPQNSTDPIKNCERFCKEKLTIHVSYWLILLQSQWKVVYTMAANVTGFMQVCSRCCREFIHRPAWQGIRNSDWEYPRYSEISMVWEKNHLFSCFCLPLFFLIYTLEVFCPFKDPQGKAEVEMYGARHTLVSLPLERSLDLMTFQ